MSRLNDIIGTIRGGVEEEPQPRSGIDTVKNFLKAAAMTTIAGAVGGEAGMRALGGYAQGQSAARERRRLDKIARAKDALAAERDIASIAASEANVAGDKRRLDLAEKEQFQRQVERTEEGQQRLRELQLKLKQDAAVEADRNKLEREKWGIKQADNVAKAQNALKKKQAADAESKVRKFSEKASQPLINPSDDQIAAHTAELANQFRQEYGVQTADQAARTWDTLVAEGRLRLDRTTSDQTRQRLIDKFAAEEKFMAEQARIRAGLPASGQMPEPAGNAINTLSQYVPIVGQPVIDQLTAGTRYFPRGGSR